MCSTYQYYIRAGFTMKLLWNEWTVSLASVLLLALKMPKPWMERVLQNNKLTWQNVSAMQFWTALKTVFSSHSDFPQFLLLCCWAHLLNSYFDYCIRPQNSRWFFFFPFFLKWESNCTTERYMSCTIMENCMRRKWKPRDPLCGVGKLKW